MVSAGDISDTRAVKKTEPENKKTDRFSPLQEYKKKFIYHTLFGAVFP